MKGRTSWSGVERGVMGVGLVGYSRQAGGLAGKYQMVSFVRSFVGVCLSVCEVWVVGLVWILVGGCVYAIINLYDGCIIEEFDVLVLLFLFFFCLCQG
jgi:hypothetical protein